MTTTWTWLRAWDRFGTRATIITELATDTAIADFNERYTDAVEVYRRPAGHHWDGSKMPTSEVALLKAKPYVRYC